MSKLGDLELGIITSQQKEYNNTAPSKVMEDGFEIADNIEHAPITITISGTITDNPFDKKEELISMRDKSETYTYVDEKNYKSYDNIVIESLTLPDNVDVSNGFEYDLNLKQVLTVSRIETEIILGADPVTEDEVVAGPVRIKKEPETVEKNDDEMTGWGSFKELGG